MENGSWAEQVERKALETFGEGMQETICIEEMSELIKEICKAKRGTGSREHIAEEIADVEIMLEQMKLLYGIHREVACAKFEKLERLESRIERFEKERRHEREA